jgi:hypothetical protein
VQRKCVVDVEVQLMPINLNELCMGVEVVNHVTVWSIQLCKGLPYTWKFSIHAKLLNPSQFGECEEV